MYLNERAWEIQQEDPYAIDCAIKRFLDIYAAVKRKHPRKEIYVPESEPLYLRASGYSIEKWLAAADREYRRLYLLFRQKQIFYHPEDEYEITFEGIPLKGGTEAYLNHSFMVSVCLDHKWEKEMIEGEFCSLEDDKTELATVNNVFCMEQLESSPIREMLDNGETFKVNSYTELWQMREEIFPHLKFCPSVENNLQNLERFYMGQVVKKLMELEKYCGSHGNERFNPALLSKATPESDGTMKKYQDEHTFTDEKGTKYLASWHVRFTGIPGRIFFIPGYDKEVMLICYIGKKLPNITYPT